MNIVLYTQRVDIVESYEERRDCADQNISLFIETCGYLPVAVPNIPNIAKDLIYVLKPVGIVFTGGNSLVKYGGNAPERDKTERLLLDVAIKNNIPLYGFCRGMQVILDYFGCQLVEVKNHVAVRHKIYGETEKEVNSFHNQGCKYIKEPLKVTAYADDGVVEAIEHNEYKIVANMWHPEREKIFSEMDKEQLWKLFGKGEKV